MEYNFHKLKIWENAHQLTLEIYRKTQSFPKSELYGITSQIRRAVSSVPANIVEGYARKSKKEFIQYLYQAKASLNETAYFLILSKDLNYISAEIYEVLQRNTSILLKMLNSFIKQTRIFHEKKL